ncbi:hypothetical protein [Croceivirga radicis]|uniref:Fibronectin type-III domain-containing protein n=1 Tax=Croceivirga radicis TaxID=1929488 RepID=A0A1V6LNP8_9FLAO|nr:hypothetical protein [Croceivirga radicis]OQD41824.1 hypothetical protein BUL40_13275 [Croceivirga radicis]
MNKYLYTLLTGLLIASCGGSDSSGGSSTDDVEPTPSPTAAILVFPEDNTECNTGEIVNEQESRVTFVWNASENTDSYELSLTNLNTNNTITPTVRDTELRLTLLRGVPYEWSVTSKSDFSNEEATSSTFRFFNEGFGIENYAPFPAEVISPENGINLMNNTSEVNLIWEASDLDEDIVSFEVLFGNENPPVDVVSETNDSFLNNVNVSSGNTYYWRIITKDTQSNSSISPIFEFKVL